MVESGVSRTAKAVAFSTIGGLAAVSVMAARSALAAERAAAQGVDAAATALGSTQQTIIAVLAGFASLLATQFFQMYREHRNRRWDLQDRAHARTEMRQHAETQRLETVQTAIELAMISKTNREVVSEVMRTIEGEVLRAIQHNTEITSQAAGRAQQAYTEANQFNEKLAALHRELINQKAQGTSEPQPPTKAS